MSITKHGLLIELHRLSERSNQSRKSDTQNKQSLSPNKWTKVYNLCKRDSLVVVAQLCPEFTGKLVDRWQELEAAAAQPTLPPVNLTRMQLIELARDAEGERLVLESKVDQLKTTMTRFVQQFEEILQTEGTLASKGFQAFRETQASLASNPLSPQPKLSTFEFEGCTVRVVTDATGETRFVGKDVCQVLGFRQHSRVIHESCRGEMKYHHFPAGRGKQPHRLLSEADVFLLVDKSVSPSANTFWQHLQDEFLPGLWGRTKAA